MDIDTYYDGAVFTYPVSAGGSTAFYDSMRLDLSDFLQLVSVEVAGGPVIISEADLRACGPGPLFYDCPPFPCPGCSNDVGVNDVTVQPSIESGAQVVRWRRSSGTELNTLVPMRVRVRMRIGSVCGLPELDFRDVGDIPVGIERPAARDVSAQAACSDAAHVTAITLQGAPLRAARNEGQTTLTLALQIESAAGTTSTLLVNERVSDPLVFARLTECNMGGGLGVECASLAPGIMDVTGVADQPVTLGFVAVNDPNPTPGDLNLAITIGTTFPFTEAFVIEVQQPVSRMTLTTSTSPFIPETGGQVDIDALAAFNTSNGYEPPDVSFFEVVPGSVQPETAAAQVASWLDPESGVVTVPPTVSPIRFDVWAIPADPVDSSIHSEAIMVVAGATPAPCRIVPADESIGIGESRNLTLEVDDGSGFAPASFAVNWVLEPEGVGTFPAGASGNPVLYLAPAVPGTVTVRADVEVGRCTTEPTLTLSSQRDLDLSLVMDKLRVAPGALVRAQVQLRNPGREPQENLVVRARFPPGLAPLRDVPVTGVGAQVSAVRARRDAQSIDLAAGTAQAALDYPLLVRPSFGCGKLPIAFTLQRQIGGEVLDREETEIEVLCDPELSEATLIGRVFLDGDGDGEQDDGEPGLPGVVVATSASVYAVTDAAGSYHIARMTPGRHVVKIDSRMLPAGSSVSPEHREVTLSPGLFTRVSFAVRLPSLVPERALELVQHKSGMTLAGGVPVYRATFTIPEGTVLTSRELTAKGQGEVELLLPPSGHHLLELRAQDGRRFLYSFAVHRYTQEGGSQLIVPWGPRLLFAAALPPGEAPMSALVVPTVAQPGVRYRVNGCEGEGQGGVESCAVTASPQGVDITIDPPADAQGDDPPALTTAVPVPVANASHFFVGRVGGEVGFDGGDRDWHANGAFLYRGTSNGFTVTAGADASEDLWLNDKGNTRSHARVLDLWLARDPRRIFRDLDPEQYYPTYGDGSLTVDEREAGGRFFFRLEKGESFFKWGGVATDLDDTEVGQYVRSLYGLGGRAVLGDKDLQLRAAAFAAKPGSISARDELTLTGGSLYFMSHRALVEGSLRVTLEVLDEVSRLPIRTVALVEGVDYEADYLGGRLSLDDALPYRTFGRTLTGREGGGHTGRLIVDYEYQPDGDLARDWSLGARLTGQLGPVQLSTSAVGEFFGGTADKTYLQPTYQLVTGAARLDLGEPFTLRLELAHSENASHLAARSDDGGLSYESYSGGRGRGYAAVAEATSELGPVKSAAYGRYSEPGFNDSRTARGRRLVQGGLRLDADLETKTELWAQLDHREENVPGTDLRARVLGLLGAAQRVGPMGFAAEGRFERDPREELTRATAGIQVSYRLTSDLELSVRRQQIVTAPDEGVLASDDSGETAVGAAWIDPGTLTAGAEVGASDDLEPFARLQATVPLEEGTELYGSYLLRSRLASSFEEPQGPGTRVLFGGRRVLADGTQLFADQHVDLAADERALVRSVGATVPAARRLSFTLSYERGVLDPLTTPVPSHELIERDAGAAGVTYAGERLVARLLADGRHDDAPAGRTASLGAQARLDFRVTDDLTLAGGLRGGEAYAIVDDEFDEQRHVWEGTLGFALRPVRTERLNVFGRYALTDESEAQTDVRSRSHLGALAVLIAVLHPIDVGPKVYYRYTRVTAEGGGATDHALLGALRGDLHLTSELDASLEGRACGSPKSDLETRYGALVEASMLALGWLRLGAGYNLSEISTAGVRCEEPGARGLFVRAEAVY